MQTQIHIKDTEIVEQEALPICYGNPGTLTPEQIENVREWKENVIDI